MIVFAAAIVVGGTGAFFSDVETSTGNVFTAGAIDLKVDSVSHVNGLVCFSGLWHPESVVQWNAQTQANELVPNANVQAAVTAYNTSFPSNVPQAGTECTGTWAMTDLGPTNTFFNYGDLKPGDNGENTISLHVYDNDAYMCAVVSNVSEKDNTQTEPESSVDTNGLAGGELGSELNFFVWEDDGDNVFESETEGNKILVNGGDAQGVSGVYPLYTPSTSVIPGDATKYLGVYWCYGDFALTAGQPTCDGGPVTNIGQTDSLSADISFYVEQARNNPGFKCPTLGAFEPDWVETTATGGDALEAAGKLTLTTINDVNSRVRYTNTNVPANLLLSSVTGFTYDAKQVSAADAVNGNASFRIIVDLLGDGSVIKDLAFEPYYNIAAHNPLNAASILTGVSQTWVATQTDGKFWASGVTTAAGVSGGGGAYATNFTLAQLVAAYPLAEVVGISVGMGTYNVNQVVEVDNLNFNGGMITGF